MSITATTVSLLRNDIQFHARAALVAAKQYLNLPRRSDATFYVERFDRALRAGSVGRNLLICATGKNDGAGSQAQALMSAMAFAHAHDLPYVHRPFTFIEHAETDMPAWVQACEDHFNLGDSEQTLADLVDFPNVAVEDLPLAPTRSPIVVSAQHYLRFCNLDHAAWERIRPVLRSKFWRNKARPAKHPHEIRVAVHMRRGDVSQHDTKVAANFTPNSVFINTLQRLQALLASRGQTARFEIHSQGTPDQFAHFESIGATLHLDKPALETHRALIEADVLIMSKGAFSYTAGLLNDGIVLYDPQKYRPAADWIVRAADGSFDDNLVLERLAERQA